MIYPRRVSLLRILRLQQSYVHNLQLLYFNAAKSLEMSYMFGKCARFGHSLRKCGGDGRLLCYLQLSQCTNMKVPLATLCHKPKGGWIFGVQKIKRTRMQPPWKGPFCSKIDSGPGYLKLSTLHMFWRELKHFATKELLWCSLEPIVFDACMILHTYSYFAAAGLSRLPIRAPLCSPGMKSRIKEQIARGQHVLTITVRFKLDFKLAWHQV